LQGNLVKAAYEASIAHVMFMLKQNKYFRSENEICSCTQISLKFHSRKTKFWNITYAVSTVHQQSSVRSATIANFQCEIHKERLNEVISVTSLRSFLKCTHSPFMVEGSLPCSQEPTMGHVL